MVFCLKKQNKERWPKGNYLDTLLNVSCHLLFLIIDDIQFILVLQFLYWLLNHCVQSSSFNKNAIYIFVIFSVKKTRMIDVDAGRLNVYGIQESRFRISDLLENKASPGMQSKEDSSGIQNI